MPKSISGLYFSNEKNVRIERVVLQLKKEERTKGLEVI